MKLLSSAVTHCRFEASDSGQDEVVLLRILMLMQEMMSGVGGDLLSDESVCEMMETGLSMCCQMRLSEMLRRSAEMTMLKMVQAVFLRLRDQDPADDDLISAAATPMGSPKMTPLASPRKSPIKEPNMTETNGHKAEDNTDLTPNVIEPYGIMSVRELLRVLISILNPNERQHTDSMRIMALRIIEVAFEVGGLAIAQRPSLRKLATDDLCKYLFQLIRSDNHIVLQCSLRVISTLLHTMRVHLKLQQELFLNYVVACLVPRAEALKESGIDPAVYEALPIAPRVKQLTSGRSTPVPVRDQRRLGLEGGARGADAREVMIECIGSLVRIPTFMIDLFVNYDCEENLSDLCEDVIGFLCRNAFPDAAIWSTSNVPPLCLDALLGFITLVHSRLESTTNQITGSLPDPAKLSQARGRKELIVKAAAKFNEDPKVGVQFMKDNGLIDTANETKSLAAFLFASGRINKKLLGDFISKPKNLPLLQAFVKLFDFRSKRLDEALRDLLQSFRLPGEAQQIARIVEEFASIYFTSGTGDIRSADAAYVLSYAVIMLNTDQHNPQAKKSKMTTVDFAKNLRGTNDGEDFSSEYLQSIYDDIKNNEIIMPEEHDTSASFEYAWKELLAKVGTAGPLVICETNLYDQAMFRSTWRPLIATLTFVFQSATDDAVFSRVIGGLSQCAAIASHYKLSEVLDQIILSLSRMTLISAEEIPGIANNTIVEVDKQKVTVSELGVAFGREFKAQLAMVILARICNGNEASIREGWAHLFDIFSALLINSLLPINFSPIHKHMKISPIPLPPPNRSSKSVQRNQESSFFGSLSSYLSSYASDEPPQPTTEEIESTMCTFDCITSCHFDDIAAHIMEIDLDSAEALVNYLIQSPDSSSPSKVAVTALLASNDEKPTGIDYDPGFLLKLEIATALALRDVASTQQLANGVLEKLIEVIQQAPTNHILMTERVLSYALRLYQALLETGQPPRINMIDTLSGLDDVLIKTSAVPIAYGMLDCLNVESALASISGNQNSYKLLSKLQENPDASPLIFEIASSLAATVNPSTIFIIVDLLNGFATAGEIGYQDEMAALQAKRSSHNAKKNNQKLAVPAKPSTTHKAEVQRACRAIELLYQLRTELTHFAKEADDPSKFWLPILRSLRDQCLNLCREVRQYAFTHLQRLLLSLDLSSNNPSHSLIFDEVLIKLLKRLMEPSNPLGKSKTLEDTQVQCSSLTCKAWLHHFASFQASEDATNQWSRVLQTLIELMQTNSSPYLAEAVTESIKNVLLVMSSSDVLVRDTPIWSETSRLLGNAKLDTMNDLFGQHAQVEEKVDAAIQAEAVSDEL